ncbi:hypothetical protein A1OE_1157 [Candidatus Endolissoclinum faulkneri L2]|uniref:Uncharacterized protein n=1 Tax=Candidatus Endolissoclinum faulkneri L2 TaxID=1193729 RepID=K7YIA4_9PROT|nr:hypothetical protein A1OE_1157 [Candidatus Endolissoclinum faulkneri L2]
MAYYNRCRYFDCWLLRNNKDINCYIQLNKLLFYNTRKYLKTKTKILAK